jgi:heptosyltransferase III
MAFVAGLRRAGLRVRSAVKNLRRHSRLALGHLLARITGPRAAVTDLTPEQISSVLVCRINGRIGNTLFLTPLLRRIHELLPGASIDVAASNPQAGELFASLPGVRSVIAFPHKRPRLVRRYCGALLRLRAQRYDLAIDPVPESTSGRIALSLCRARYRLGFATGSQWAPLTHAVPEPTGPMHQAVQPLVLLCRAFNTPCDLSGVQLSLCLRQQEIDAGRLAVATAISPLAGPTDTGSRAFGFFAHATASKTIERSWWLAFWKAFLELEPDAVPLEFLPTPRTTPTDSRFPTLHFSSTRALTAAMAATRVFISADTGPMHLASSTSVPTVALFQASNPALYGPLKPSDVAIDLGACTPQRVAQRCQRVWRESAQR